MEIYNNNGKLILTVPVLMDAIHEEELMKSDFVKLVWNADDGTTLPTDAYIIPFEDGVRYSLLEPYTPEQKSEAEWKYETNFQHPKMYLGKVPFTFSATDEDGNPETLLSWPYTGGLSELLQYFCDAINDVFGFTGEDVFSFEVIGSDIGTVVSTTFDNQDVLSALSNIANAQECEYHIDWSQRLLLFGHVATDREELSVPVLEVARNIGIPTIRDSRDGFWNAFLPQGSTRNITRMAKSGEAVQATIRLSLAPNTEYTFQDVDGTVKAMETPDGIVYTDDHGHLVTKAVFEASGRRRHIKSVIFEDVYPKFSLYLYDVRCREFYKKDEDGNNTDVKYAQWFCKLAYPDMLNGHVTQWHQYTMEEYYVSNKIQEIQLTADYGMTASGKYTYELEIGEFRGRETQIEQFEVFLKGYKADGNIGIPGTVTVDGTTFDVWIDKGSIHAQGGVKHTLVLRIGELYNTITRAKGDATGAALYAAYERSGTMLFDNTFKIGLKSLFGNVMKHSQVVDGKDMMIAFNANLYKRQTGVTEDGVPQYHYAQSSPLAGRGSGDGDGHYGFGLKYIATSDDARSASKDSDDSVPVEEPVTVEAGDFAIVFEEDGNYVLPTTASLGIIPRGMVLEDGTVVTSLSQLTGQDNLDDGQTGNNVNIYNIAVGKEYERQAQQDLASEVSKYIINQFVDNNSYTFNSNPIVFEKELANNNPEYNLYIGRKVVYKDISGKELETRVQKLITHLDFPFEQEITVGNEILKGTTAQLKEQVSEIIQGSYGGAGGGMSYSAIRTLIQNWVTPRFLSKINDDTESGLTGFLKGLWIKAKELFGIDSEGNATLNSVTAKKVTSPEAAVDRFTKLATFLYGLVTDSVESTQYTNDSGWRIAKGADGKYTLTADKAVFRDAVATVLGTFEQVMTNIINASRASVGMFTNRPTFSQGLLTDRIESYRSAFTGGTAGFVIRRTESGRYYMEIDDLLVRGKAIFNELEIRKLSYVGGNIELSGAGSVIYRAVPLYAQADSTANPDAYSEERQEGFVLVGHRCFMVADDGTTRTRNWWKVGDQAKCQTFNIGQELTENSHFFSMAGKMVRANDGILGWLNSIWHNATNRYYWRLVTGTGSRKLEDGKQYDYVDLSCVDYVALEDSTGQTVTCIGYQKTMDAWEEGNYSEELRELACDYPAAGDSIVQEGSQTDPDRQHVIRLSVIGENAPAIEEFVGVGTVTQRVVDGEAVTVGPFSLEDRAMTRIAPRTGDIFVAKSFEIRTDSGLRFRVPCDRGDYADDTQFNYYDRVSFVKADNTKSLWLHHGTTPTTGVAPGMDATVWQEQVSGVKGDDGNPGEDSLSIGMVPSAIILQEVADSKYDEDTGLLLTDTHIDFSPVSYLQVFHGTRNATRQAYIKGLSAENCTGEIVEDGQGVRITSLTGTPTNGRLVLSVSYDGSTYIAEVPFAVNYVGTYTQKIVNDLKQEMAGKTVHWTDGDGVMHETKGLTEIITDADGIRQRVSRTEDDVALNASKIEQLADGITLAVEGTNRQGNIFANGAFAKNTSHWTLSDSKRSLFTFAGRLLRANGGLLGASYGQTRYCVYGGHRAVRFVCDGGSAYIRQSVADMNNVADGKEETSYVTVSFDYEAAKSSTLRILDKSKSYVAQSIQAGTGSHTVELAVDFSKAREIYVAFEEGSDIYVWNLRMEYNTVKQAAASVVIDYDKITSQVEEHLNIDEGTISTITQKADEIKAVVSGFSGSNRFTGVENGAGWDDGGGSRTLKSGFYEYDASGSTVVSPWVYVPCGEDYVLSFYCNEPPVGLCDLRMDFSVDKRAIGASEYFEFYPGEYVAAEVLDDATEPNVYRYAHRFQVPGGFSEESGAWVRVTFNDSQYPWTFFYKPQLEPGTHPTPFNVGRTGGESFIKQRTDGIEAEVRNLSGEMADVRMQADSISSYVGKPVRENLFGNINSGWAWYRYDNSLRSLTFNRYVTPADGGRNFEGDEYNAVVSKTVYLEAGKTYCMSFASDAGNNLLGIYITPNAASNGELLFVKRSYKDSGEYTDTNNQQRYYVVFDELPVDGYYRFAWHDSEYQSELVDNPKLEEGSSPSADAPQYSEVSQMAERIRLMVSQGLAQTGIDIVNRLITLVADKTVFADTDGRNMIAVQMCDAAGNVGQGGIPSIVFYDGEIGNGGQPQWVLNYLGFLQAVSSGVHYRFDKYQTGTVVGSLEGMGTENVIEATAFIPGNLGNELTDSYLFHSGYHLDTHGNKIYDPANGVFYENAFYTGSGTLSDGAETYLPQDGTREGFFWVADSEENRRVFAVTAEKSGGGTNRAFAYSWNSYTPTTEDLSAKETVTGTPVTADGNGYRTVTVQSSDLQRIVVSRADKLLLDFEEGHVVGRYSFYVVYQGLYNESRKEYTWDASTARIWVYGTADGDVCLGDAVTIQDIISAQA